MFSTAFSQLPFTAGNLVIYKVGNGTDTLSSAGFQVNLEEFTATGSFVQSHPMPTVVVGSNKRIIASGSASSEGQIARSVDKRFLLVTGYDTIIDPAKLSLSGSPSVNVNRVVGIIGADGVIDATTALADSYGGNNFRGAASTNGTDLWLAGTASSSINGGVRYTTKGATTAKRLSSTVTNIRAVAIYNGQLYCSTGSGNFKAVSAVGTGLPVDSPQVITVLPGFPTTSATGGDPYMFSINPTGNLAYVADNRSKQNGGGIQKWAFNGATWNLQYTLDSGLTAGLRNIVVNWSGTNPTIYAISGDPVVKDLPGNKFLKLVDIDSMSAFAVLAIAPVNTIFRGISFAPENAVVATTYTFTGNGLWSQAANWAGNAVPPLLLPSAAAIIINHIVGGQCQLNVSQRIQPGARLTVNTGKNLIVQGSLTIQ